MGNNATMNEETILIIEDDGSIREGVRILMEAEGYHMEEAENGYAGIKIVKDTERVVDLILLDIMMPGLSGIKTCQEIRKISNAPILFLTAKDQESDKLMGLMAGGDDYLVKPFAFEKLLARVRVLLRKPEEMPKTCYTIADLEVHLDTHKVIRGKEEIRLSGKEFALLRYMVQNAGIVLSRDRLEQHLWNYDYMGSSNVIDVYIRYLRKKIDDGREKKLIHTVRGVGYVLKEEE